MRSVYWDGWKGLSILAVVAIHASSESGKLPAETFGWYFGLISRQFFNFAVPLFLAFAGYFAVSRRVESPGHYYKSRLQRILPPYLFWTAVFVLVRYPSHFLSPMDLSRDVLMGMGIDIGYFVVVLVQYIALTPLIARIRSGSLHFLLMGGATAAGLGLVYFSRLQHPDAAFSQYPVYILPFFSWYPFYHLGYVAAQRKWAADAKFGHTAPWFLGLFVVFTAAAVFESLLLAQQGLLSFGASQCKVSSFAASACLFLYAVAAAGHEGRSAFRRLLSSPVMVWLGRNSYPIYLSHLLFFPASVKVLRAIPHLYAAQPLFIVLDALMMLSAAVLLIRFTQRFAPSRLQRYMLGAQPSIAAAPHACGTALGSAGGDEPARAA